MLGGDELIQCSLEASGTCSSELLDESKTRTQFSVPSPDILICLCR